MIPSWSSVCELDVITRPRGAQILELGEPGILLVTLPNSEISPNSNYDEHSTYQTHTAITPDMNKNEDNEIKTNIPNSTSPLTPIAITGNNLSKIFDATNDQLENDISASIDFSVLEYFNQELFDISSLVNPLPLGDLVDGSRQYDQSQGFQASHPPPGMLQMLDLPPVSMGYEDGRGLTPFMGYRTSVDPMLGPFLTSGNIGGPAFSCQNLAGNFTGTSLTMGNAVSHQDLSFQGDGIFLPDSIMPGVFQSELQQSLNCESQHLALHGSANSTTTLSTGNSNLDDPTSFKVAKLSVEERKKKIERYMKKRTERNFSKKIKYACRKTLADSRPRIRGRFAKNDEQVEVNKAMDSNLEYEADEDVIQYSCQKTDDHQPKVKVEVKEEEDFDSSSNVLAHISGVNSFKCSYPIQTLI